MTENRQHEQQADVCSDSGGVDDAVNGSTAKSAATSAEQPAVEYGPDGPFCPIAARKARRRRRLKWHLGIWSVLLIVLGVLFAIMLSMSLTGRVIALPDWVTMRVEAGINAQTDRVDLSLHKVEFGFGKTGIPRLRLVDVGVKDQTGLEVARLNTVEGGLRLRDAIRGQIKPAWLKLQGAQVTLRRRANGDFDLSLGQGSGASGDLATILDVIDTEFTDGTLAELQEISTEGLTITLEDARSGRLWQVTDGRLKVTQNTEAVDITVAFDVFNQTEELAETVLGFRAFKGRSGATMTATFKNALARDIAAQSPVMAFLDVIDAPISGALHTVISDAGSIQDLAGTLEFGAGAVQPGRGVQPIRFDGGKVYMDYDPERERIDFAEMSVTTDWGKAKASGHAYLRGWERGWPAEMIGQLSLENALIAPPDTFESPLSLSGGGADFRLRLDPFTLEVGTLSIKQDAGRLTGRGRAIARDKGWDLAMELAADRLTPKQILAFWPLEKGSKTRKWVATKIRSGAFANVNASLRMVPGGKPQVALTAEMQDVTAEVVRDMVPVENMSGRFSIVNNRLVVTADAGIARPDGKAALDLSGTSFIVPDLRIKPAPAQVRLAVRGDVPSALTLLAAPPYRIFRDSEKLGPEVIDGGSFTLSGTVDVVLKRKPRKDEIQFDLGATLRNASSKSLVPGHDLIVKTGQLQARHDGVTLTGAAQLGQVPLTATWELPLRNPKLKGRSSVSGKMALDQRLLGEMKIALPKGSVTGRGQVDFDLVLEKGQPARLEARSDLAGVGLGIGALGWSKPKSAKGGLQIDAVLSKPAQVTRLDLSAPGLSARGKVRLKEDGGLDAAQFDQVKLGGWLDAPVTLTGRGPGLPVAISVTGGSVDMRRATLGSGKGGSVNGAVPIDLILDRLVISSGITLTQFQGKFEQNNGTTGTFRARVGGGPQITGAAAPQAKGTAFRINSTDAGGVMRAAGVFKTAYGGKMELVLAPGGGAGTYEGELNIKDVSIQNAPAMAELLSAVSVIGLLQQLGGQGIRFGEVEARFRLDPKKVTVYRSSAVGHSMGISMDGYYHLGSSEMEMQGVISPFYIVNSAGRALARKGEGLVGFNYTLGGTAEKPKVRVNPLSLFTPGFFRDIFRRAPPPRPAPSPSQGN